MRRIGMTHSPRETEPMALIGVVLQELGQEAQTTRCVRDRHS
jgi:hypothetical protein